MSSSWMSEKGRELSALDGGTACRCGHALELHSLETDDVTCIGCDCDGFREAANG